MTVEIAGRIEPEQAPEIAEAHIQAFPGFFLSSLGSGFLELLYRGFAEHPDALIAVATDAEGRLLGAAVGSRAPDRFFGDLLRRHWFAFGCVAARHCLVHPGSVPKLLGALGYRGERPAVVPAEAALLSSIFVTAPGGGVGSALLARWLREATEAGLTSAFLYTDADDNDAVNLFYQRNGWRLAEASGVRRRRNCYVRTIG